MLKIRDVINKIEEDFPIESAMSFDNSGANIVDYDNELKNIIVCLDITIDAIEYANDNNANLIISHHPIIFNEIRNITDNPVSKRIKLLNKYGISAYSCHTNFDINIGSGMGINLLNKLFDTHDLLEHRYLETYKVNEILYGLGDIIVLKNKLSFSDILSMISEKLSIDYSKIVHYNFNNSISKIIIVPGRGSSEIDMVVKNKPDLLITSDLKHNNIIDLMDEKISYINPSHYGLEKVFIDSFYEYLKSSFDKMNIYKYELDL